jgi:hypothetical protein
MDISAEKEDIIRRFKQVNDIDLIKAIKSLLDFGLQRQEDDYEDDPELNESIKRGINELENGMGIPHEQVMAEIRKRYGL